MPDYDLPMVEREIDGIRFRITKLPYKKSRATLLLVGKKIFPALTKAAQGVNFGDALAATADRKARIAATVGPRLVEAMSELFENLDIADLDKLDEAFGPHCTFDNGTDASGETRWASLGAEVNRETVFGGGKMLRYTRWLLACMEVTYADFFAGLRARSGPSS